MRLVHDHPLVDLPLLPIDETWCIETMRGLLDHPWIRDRRTEVEAQLDRLEVVIERARARPRPDVICHTDFGGHNALVDDDTGEVVAVLDWDHAGLAPREHDLWAAFEEPDPNVYLDAYGRDVDLDPPTSSTPFSPAALRDATARVATERDREGIETWGFARWRTARSEPLAATAVAVNPIQVRREHVCDLDAAHHRARMRLRRCSDRPRSSSMRARRVRKRERPSAHAMSGAYELGSR